MTVSEPPGDQPPGDDPALLTTALNHSWAWYEMRSSRAFQTLNYYLVATAILFTAYTNVIGKRNGIAAAVAIAGIVLTLLALMAALYEVNAAFLAECPLDQVQARIAGRLHIGEFQMARHLPANRQRQAVVVITFGAATLLDIAGLVYALTR